MILKLSPVSSKRQQGCGTERHFFDHPFFLLPGRRCCVFRPGRYTVFGGPAPPLARLLALRRVGDRVIVVAPQRLVGLPSLRLNSFLGWVGWNETLHPPIRSWRPASIRASRTVNQFSGLKNCICARCIFLSRIPLAILTGVFVKGSIPV